MLMFSQSRQARFLLPGRDFEWILYAECCFVRAVAWLVVRTQFGITCGDSKRYSH
jgi:hypothetical protein